MGAEDYIKISSDLEKRVKYPNGTLKSEKLDEIAKDANDPNYKEAREVAKICGNIAEEEGNYGQMFVSSRTLNSGMYADVEPDISSDYSLGKNVIGVLKIIGGLFSPTSLMSCGEYDPLEYIKEPNLTLVSTTVIKNNIEVVIQGAAAQSDPELAATLSAILAAINAGNEIEANNGVVLDKILDILKSIDSRVTNLEGGVAQLNDTDAVKVDLLTKILAKLESLENEQKDMNDAAKTFYTTLLAKLDTMGADYLQKILDKMDVIDGKLGEMKDADAAFYAELLAKMDTLGDKADTIIAKFEALVFPDGGQPTDLTNVEALLQQILDAVKANGDKLDVNNEKLEAIFNKIDAIPGKLDAIKEKLDTLSNAPDYTALLQEIRDKIQPCQGHDCDHTDVINALLDIKLVIEQIKDKVNQSNDPHHEGILDDLDNIFG